MIGVVILLLLLLSAYIDIKLQIIPPYIPLLIIMATCLDKNFLLAPSFISGVFSTLLLLVPTLIKNNCFGGGDIKLVAALGFYLGFITTLQAVAVAMIFSIIYSKTAKKNGTIPFAPFLAIAFAPTILITRCFI